MKLIYETNDLNGRAIVWKVATTTNYDLIYLTNSKLNFYSIISLIIYLENRLISSREDGKGRLGMCNEILGENMKSIKNI